MTERHADGLSQLQVHGWRFEVVNNRGEWDTVTRVGDEDSIDRLREIIPAKIRNATPLVALEDVEDHARENV